MRNGIAIKKGRLTQMKNKLKWYFGYYINVRDGLKFRAYLPSKHYILATNRKSHRLGIKQVKKILDRMYEIKNLPDGTKEIMYRWWLVHKENGRVYLKPLKIIVNTPYVHKVGLSLSDIEFPSFTLEEVEEVYRRALKDVKEGKVKELGELGRRLEESFRRIGV